MKKLVKIQSELKAAKNQRNNFGKYNYRSCEDILESVKPLLKEAELHLIVTDKIVLIGERYYVEATATLHGDGEPITSTAYAREAENKKGMDSAQVTGATSSYARKYALNGLFAIDDSKDADTMKPEVDEPEAPKKPVQPVKKTLNEADFARGLEKMGKENFKTFCKDFILTPPQNEKLK